MNSLGAKFGTDGRRSALAARLTQLSMSRLDGKRVAAGWASLYAWNDNAGILVVSGE